MLSPRCTISSLGNDYLSGEIKDVVYIRHNLYNKEKRYHEALENPLVLEKIMGYVEKEDRAGCFYFARALMYLGYELDLDRNYLAHILNGLDRKIKNGDYQRFRNILYGRTVSYFCTHCFDKIKPGSPFDCISYRPLCDHCFKNIYKDHVSEFEARTIMEMLGFSKSSVEIACLGIEFTNSKIEGCIRRMNIARRREMTDASFKGILFLPFRRMGKGGENIFLRRHIVELDSRYVGRRSVPKFINIYTFMKDAIEDLDFDGEGEIGAFEAFMLHNIIEGNEWTLKALRRRFAVDATVWDNAVEKIRAKLLESVRELSDKKKASLAAEVIMMEDEDFRLGEAFCSMCDGSCLKPILRQEKSEYRSSQTYVLDFCYGCQMSKAGIYSQINSLQAKKIAAHTAKSKKEYRCRYLSM